MSRIIEKAFDASKKIIRSIFRGSPNLITSSDLNRQIEALKYQLDVLEDKTGFITTEGTVSATRSSSVVTVGFSCNSLYFKGVDFGTFNFSGDSNFTDAAPYVYLVLIAESSLVTYEDDFSHEISGAKFEDGTSMAAADNLVYKNSKLVLSHSLNVGNKVGVVAQIYLDENAQTKIKKNFREVDNPLIYSAFDAELLGNESSVKLPLKKGMTYEDSLFAIAKFVNGNKESGYYQVGKIALVDERNSDYPSGYPNNMTTDNDRIFDYYVYKYAGLAHVFIKNIDIICYKRDYYQDSAKSYLVEVLNLVQIVPPLDSIWVEVGVSKILSMGVGVPHLAAPITSFKAEVTIYPERSATLTLSIDRDNEVTPPASGACGYFCYPCK